MKKVDIRLAVQAVTSLDLSIEFEKLNGKAIIATLVLASELLRRCMSHKKRMKFSERQE